MAVAVAATGRPSGNFGNVAAMLSASQNITDILVLFLIFTPSGQVFRDLSQSRDAGLIRRRVQQLGLILN